MIVFLLLVGIVHQNSSSFRKKSLPGITNQQLKHLPMYDPMSYGIYVNPLIVVSLIQIGPHFQKLDLKMRLEIFARFFHEI